ncbi:hypothetical protein TSUD_37760 [Trifolium subterraneum]|uniref:Uncharacterized protein n=1 Tax=Trifolium subterraneum TaxID=3900 RepID=A0A2Z6MG23_TRISU|nr:hypothetical protein TSUD_37760 [Trifolium subterraneum]
MKIEGDVSGDRFKHNVSNMMGNAKCLRFRHEIWTGHVCLKNMYPQLFRKALRPGDMIAYVGLWHEHKWSWQMLWAEELTLAKKDAATELSCPLKSISLSLDFLDRKR